MPSFNARIEAALARLEANLNINVDLSRRSITNIVNTRTIARETRSITYRIEQTDLGDLEPLLLQVRNEVQEVLIRQNLLHEEDLDQFRLMLRRLEGILAYLESNFPEIQDTLGELKTLIENSVAALDASILGYIEESQLQILQTLGQTFNTFLGELERAIDVTVERIQNEDRMTRDLMNQIKADLLQRIQTCETRIKIAVEEAKSSILTALQTANEEVLVSLIEINGLIVASKEITLAMRVTILAVIAGLAGEIGGLTVLCGNIESSVLYNRAVVRNQSSIIQRLMRNLILDAKNNIIQTLTDQITASKKELSKQIQDFVDADTKYKEELDKTLSKLPEKTAIETSLHVVGESYYRWDSVTTYFPTLTFLFRELGDTTYPRRSQIKVRLRQKNEELTELDIEKLKVSCQAVSTLRYTYGNTRVNYVSSDKRFKTTMFAEDAQMAINILQNICDVIEEPFLERNLSLTIGRIQ